MPPPTPAQAPAAGIRREHITGTATSAILRASRRRSMLPYRPTARPAQADGANAGVRSLLAEVIDVDVPPREAVGECPAPNRDRPVAAVMPPSGDPFGEPADRDVPRPAPSTGGDHPDRFAHLTTADLG